MLLAASIFRNTCSTAMRESRFSSDMVAVYPCDGGDGKQSHSRGRFGRARPKHSWLTPALMHCMRDSPPVFPPGRTSSKLSLMTQTAKKASARPPRALAFGAVRSRTRKKPTANGRKAEVTRVILDAALPPRHLTKSAIKAAVRQVLKETTKVAS